MQPGSLCKVQLCAAWLSQHVSITGGCVYVSAVWGNACKAELQSCVLLFAGVGRFLKHCAAWEKKRKKKKL